MQLISKCSDEAHLGDQQKQQPKQQQQQQCQSGETDLNDQENQEEQEQKDGAGNDAETEAMEDRISGKQIRCCFYCN